MRLAAVGDGGWKHGGIPSLGLGIRLKEIALMLASSFSQGATRAPPKAVELRDSCWVIDVEDLDGLEERRGNSDVCGD